MSAMAEHDCIGTHNPTNAALALGGRWCCPDCNRYWECIADRDNPADVSWHLLYWPQWELTAPGSFTL